MCALHCLINSLLIAQCRCAARKSDSTAGWPPFVVSEDNEFFDRQMLRVFAPHVQSQPI